MGVAKKHKSQLKALRCFRVQSCSCSKYFEMLLRFELNLEGDMKTFVRGKLRLLCASGVPVSL